MRSCDRPGCDAPATVTFTFSSARQTVWLDRVGATTASAGRLCHRHADALVPPRGWTLLDRRSVAPLAAPTSSEPGPTAGPPIPDPLAARTPLLARAFRAARAS
jgi:hypothetical protein